MKRNKCLSAIVLILMILFRLDITYAETVKYISCGTTKDIPYYLPSLIRTFIIIIQFVIPIIIIIIGSIDFLKVIFGNNKDDLSKAIKKFALRLIAGAAVFLLVTLVKELITITNDENNSNSLSECFSCFVVDDSYCTSYDVEVDKDSDKNENLSNIEKQKQFLEKREQQRKENEEKANSAKKRNTTGSSSGNKSNITPGTKNIFIGDSRMVGLCNSVNGTAFQTETGIYKNGNNYFIAKGAMSFSWLKNTAVPLTNQVLESNPGVRFNIIIDMGTNDAYFKASGRSLVVNVNNTYISLYQKLSNDWSGHKVIISSLNPIRDNYYLNGYVFNNDSVNQFNGILKSGIANLPNFTFCDVNSQIIGVYKTGDKIHYYPDTYRLIFQLMNNCINN